MLSADEPQPYFHMKFDKILDWWHDYRLHRSLIPLERKRSDQSGKDGIRRACTLNRPSVAIGRSTVSSSNVVRDLDVQLRIEKRQSRRSASNRLQIPDPSWQTPAPYSRQFAECAFAIAGRMLWNSLPDTVRDTVSLTAFRRLLKWHLFNIALGNN